MYKIRKYKLLLPLLFIITYSFAKYQGGFISWFLFYILIILSLYVYLTSYYSLKNIEVKRTFNKKYYVSGELIKVKITFINKTLFPHIYLLIKDDIPSKLKLTNHNSSKIIFPFYQEKSIVEYTISDSIRGIYEFKNIEVITGDVFGFITKVRKIPISNEIIVFPNTIFIENWNSKNKNNYGNYFISNYVGDDPTLLIGIREYQYGDRFSRIHWRQSARVEQLMSKEFERLITNKFLFVINQENGNYANQKHFEALVELTASLIKNSLENNFLTGIVGYTNKKIEIPLSRGDNHIIKTLELLAYIEQSGYNFNTFLNSLLTSSLKSLTLVIITSNINDELGEILSVFSTKKSKIEVFVMYYEEKNKFTNKYSNIDIHYIDYNDYIKYSKQGGIMF